MDATDGARSAVASESLALGAGAGALVLLGGVSLLLTRGDAVPLSGRGSAGDMAAVGSAALGALAVVGGLVRRRRAKPSARRVGGIWRDVVDIAALALAHACVLLIGTLALFSLFQRSFVGAVAFPFACAVLVGTAGAVSVYFAYLSAVSMNIYRLAALLAVFLFMGTITSMLTAENPQWWEMSLSVLGADDDTSGFAFNVTLILAGFLVAVVAGYSTKQLEIAALSKSAKSRRRVRLLQAGLVIMGVMLACVGLFPENLAVHNFVASGMVTVFAALVLSIPRLVPPISPAFVALGFVFLAVIVVAGVLFALGYDNLTAVELIAASLIFAWLVVLIRNLAAVDADHLDDTRRRHPRYRRTDTGSFAALET